jgi:hypothetical protein
VAVLHAVYTILPFTSLTHHRFVLRSIRTKALSAISITGPKDLSVSHVTGIGFGGFYLLKFPFLGDVAHLKRIVKGGFILRKDQHMKLVMGYIRILDSFRQFLEDTAEDRRAAIKLGVLWQCDEFADISKELIQLWDGNAEVKVFFQMEYASFCHRSITRLVR